jgi:hypothetical protein
MASSTLALELTSWISRVRASPAAEPLIWDPETTPGKAAAVNTTPAIPTRGGTEMDVLAFKLGTYSVVHQSANQYRIGDSMSMLGFERVGSGSGFLTLSAAAASGSVTSNL